MKHARRRVSGERCVNFKKPSHFDPTARYDIDDLHSQTLLPFHMALQQPPDDYAQAIKEELRGYWHEPGIVIPLDEFPFVWPESPPPQPTVYPDVSEAIPQFNLSLDETLVLPDDNATSLFDSLAPRQYEEILNTRKSEPLDLDFLAPRLRNGPHHLRKYGPTSLRKSTISFPREILQGEDGMDIRHDTSDVTKAFENDARMSVTQEDADYLRAVISRISHEKSIDIILPRVFISNNGLTDSINTST